jgi:hypothetical protein
VDGFNAGKYLRMSFSDMQSVLQGSRSECKICKPYIKSRPGICEQVGEK